MAEAELTWDRKKAQMRVGRSSVASTMVFMGHGLYKALPHVALFPAAPGGRMNNSYFTDEETEVLGAVK